MIATWWAEVFGCTVDGREDNDWWWIADIPGCPFGDWDFVPVPEPKTVKNRIHWDVLVDDVDDLVAAGARRAAGAGRRRPLDGHGRPRGQRVLRLLEQVASGDGHLSTCPADIVDLTAALVDIESVSGNEREITDAIESALTPVPVARALAARAHPDRPHRPGPGRASRDRRPRRHGADQPATCRRGATTTDLHGLGSCDMKGGVAVALKLAAGLAETNRDVTYVFYECEEVEADRNGLYLVSQVRPEMLEADFAVLMEPSNAVVEAGCQGTMRVDVIDHAASGPTAPAAGTASTRSTRAAEILDRLTAYKPRRAGDRRPAATTRASTRSAISGGVAGNVIPDALHGRASTTGSRPTAASAEAEAHMREVFDGLRPGGLRLRPGRAARASTVRRRRRSSQAVGGTPNPKFGWTDVSRFSELGIPAVNFGPGNPELAHTQAEFVPIAQICARAWTR